MFDVVALGELLIDFTHIDTSHDGYPVLAAHPGGAPCNLLAAVAKFGKKSALLGKVGNDQFGQMLRETLHGLNINTQGLISDNNAFTTLAFVTLDGNGERTFSFARKPGADMQIRPDELDLSVIKQSRIFHFGSLSLTHEPARSATQAAVSYAKSLGKLISFDPNLRPPLWDSPDTAKEQIFWGLKQADIVKISAEEVEFICELDPKSGSQWIIEECGAKLVFVTCGAEGCWYRNKFCYGHTPAPRGLKIIDTTGAGDIFGGAGLWKLIDLAKKPECLSEAELVELTRFACTAASLSTTKAGGISSVPDYDEVCALLQSTY